MRDHFLSSSNGFVKLDSFPRQPVGRSGLDIETARPSGSVPSCRSNTPDGQERRLWRRQPRHHSSVRGRRNCLAIAHATQYGGEVGFEFAGADLQEVTFKCIHEQHFAVTKLIDFKDFRAIRARASSAQQAHHDGKY